jgi:hypothetical protein
MSLETIDEQIAAMNTAMFEQIRLANSSPKNPDGHRSTKAERTLEQVSEIIIGNIVSTDKKGCCKQMSKIPVA